MTDHARIAHAVGRFLVGSGVLALLFVLHQTWGTDVRAAWQQRALRAELAQAGAGTTEAIPGSGGLRASVVPPRWDQTGPQPAALDARSAEGSPVARLRAEAIDLDVVIVDGSGREALQRGPGRVRASATLGGPGNAVIAGHRTTWGAPFSRLDKLRPGDRVVLQARGHELVYTVSGRRVTAPDDASVLSGAPGSRITLVTCHPRYSAAQRLVVTADAVPQPAPGEAVTQAASSTPVAGQVTDVPPGLLPADHAPGPVQVTLPLGVAVLTWWLGGMPWRPLGPGATRRWPRVIARAVAAIVAVLPLAVAFDRLADVVPVGW